MAGLQCQFCGAPITIAEPIPRDAECESCGHDLRCCRNCRHWDPRYNNECTETQADPVVDKARRNFCEFFYFNRAPFAAAASGASREREARTKLAGLFGGGAAPAADPRAKLDALFSKAPPTDRQADARRKLDALFEKPRPPDDTAAGGA